MPGTPTFPDNKSLKLEFKTALRITGEGNILLLSLMAC